MTRTVTSIAAGVLLLAALGVAAQPQSVTLASRTPAATVANKASLYPALAEQGRYVAFSSLSDNLVGLDSNNAYDIFVWDAHSGAVERISNGLAALQSNGSSYWPAISADGRYVAFYSLANNLVEGDTNNRWDVFVFDRQLRITERVSRNLAGGAANGDSLNPTISADGRFVAYASSATDLVANDGNAAFDVFVYDRLSRITERVSVSSSGAAGNGASDWPSLSSDGRYVAFQSSASNLVPNDSNGQVDIFVRDRSSGALVTVSSAGNGPSNWPSLSGDGRVVAFSSAASNLVSGDANNGYDVFLANLVDGSLTLLSRAPSGDVGNGASYWPRVDGRGRYVAYTSLASNLVSADGNNTWDVYVYDVRSRQTSLMSGVGQAAANNMSYWPALSPDGRYVAFSSLASNFIGGDGNASWDIFLADRGPLNRPPIANAGPDKVAECAGSTTLVGLDGSASYDPDNDGLTYTWQGGFGVLGGVQVAVSVPYGANAITLKVEDPQGEVANDGLVVQVVDTTPPSIVLSDEFRAEALSPHGAGVVIDPAVSDGCGAVNLHVNPAPASYPIGETSVTVVATDAQQNSAQKTTRVIVQDTTAPTIVAPAALTVEAQGLTTAVDLEQPLATDAVGVVALYHRVSNQFNLGETRVDWYAEDGAGNRATTTQTVTLIDTTAPVIAVPADIQYYATAVMTEVDVGAATARDAVDGDVAVLALNHGPFSVGEHIIEWRAMDRSANQSTGYQRVTILNNAPAISPVAGLYVKEGEAFSVDVAFADVDSESWAAVIDYGDGVVETFAVSMSPGSIPIRHRYANDGSYELSVLVRDPHGAEANLRVTVVVANVSPSIDSVTWPTEVVTQGETVEVFAATSDPGIRDTLSWTIDWGDGRVDAGQSVAVDGSIRLSHAYAVAGPFTVTLSVGDGAAGEESVATSEIGVVNSGQFALVGGGRFGEFRAASHAPDESLGGRIGFRLVGPAIRPAGLVSLYWRDAAGKRWKLKARAHDWMIATEEAIHLKGQGEVNGVGGFGYSVNITMVASVPRQLNWRIWNTSTGEVLVEATEAFRHAAAVVTKALPKPQARLTTHDVAKDTRKHR